MWARRPAVKNQLVSPHAVKILTYKIFAMNILRAIPIVVVRKLLILDILQHRRRDGVG